MKALVTRKRQDGKREKVLLDNWPDPPPLAANQFKTQTLFSGVTNGTERNDLLGGNYAHKDEDLPATWGYQNVGRVIETGPDVKEIKTGDVIYSSADHVEFAVIPENWLYIKLPPEIDPKEAALFGMASVAMRTCRNADLRLGERVLVVGAGIIGQIAAQIANAMGASVTICDVDERRLDLARRIGAAECVFNSNGTGWDDYIKDFSFDAILDLAGVVGMEDRLITAAKTRGRIMLIAGRNDVKYTFNFGQIHEITIKQNSHFDNTDLANLCRLVRRGQVRVAPLIQDVLPVTEAQKLYDRLRDTPAELLGTVFVW